jgi:hypothetical protein
MTGTCSVLPGPSLLSLQEYKKNLRAIGGKLNEDKSKALLGAICELPTDFPVPRGVIYDGPGGKAGNIVGYGIVCVGIPIGDPAFVKRLLELKEEEIFDKIDRAIWPVAKLHRIPDRLRVPELDDGLPRQGNGRNCVHSAYLRLHATRCKNA